MILNALDALYDRLKADASYLVPRPAHSRQKITFKIVLTPSGELLDIQDVRQRAGRALRPLQMEVPGETKPSGTGINPGFLWDNVRYLLGHESTPDASGRTTSCFEAFRDRHLALEPEIRSDAFSAVCRFLRSWHPTRCAEFPVLEEAASSGFGVFQIQATNNYVHEDDVVQHWWEKHGVGDLSGVEAQCLVTGSRAPIARLHGKIRGVAGAQSAGATIVGFNEDAYLSYGKEQSFNAPVSEAVAFRYVAALNALLDGPRRDKHRLGVGQATVAFWTERPTATEDVFAAYATGIPVREEAAAQDEGLRQKLEAFLRALREGREAYGRLEEEPEGTNFFLLGLSPNAARIAVRFFHRGSLAELLESLRRHHHDIAIERQWPKDPEFPSIWSLLRQTARETKDIPPTLEGPILESIVAGASYPHHLYAAVLRRIHADRSVDYLRACVIKGYLNRNRKEGVKMSLDTERIDPSYRLGRLFAALEKTQTDALGSNLNTTIRDAFYGAASATPRAVFPRLMRTYQHHLARLEGGRKVNREKLVQSIVEPLREFPANLDLAGQGLFAIGYYHQRQALYTRRERPEEGAREGEEDTA